MLSGNYKHGMRHTRIYNIWRSMRQRCSNEKASNYGNYGAKGISVYDEWNSFEKFYSWAMENGYNDSLTIDRINVSKDYEPSNCRWVSQKVQQNNRSNNVYVEFNGEKHTYGEWSQITGIALRTIWVRLNQLNWSIERALTEKPIIGKNQSYNK